MTRAGLTPAVITKTAAALVDRGGPAALTFARVAQELGVRPPSLYNHIDGRDGLERLIALNGLEQLVEQCRSALLGRSGGDGLRAMGHTYRAFALAHPGVYPLTQVSRPGDVEYEERADRLLQALLALLSGFGVPEADLIHVSRSVRSALHGFALLEIQGGFGLDQDVDESFRWLLHSVERSLSAGGKLAVPADSPGGRRTVGSASTSLRLAECLMSYPDQRYFGEHGEKSAWYRPTDQEPELVFPNGNTVRYLTTGAATDGLFGLDRWEMSPEQSGAQPHFHRTITESFCVLSGTIRIFDGTGWIDTAPGDFVHVPAGGIHGFRNESGQPASMLLHFAPGAPREDYFEGLLEVSDMTAEERADFFLRHDNLWVD